MPKNNLLRLLGSDVLTPGDVVVQNVRKKRQRMDVELFSQLYMPLNHASILDGLELSDFMR
eukprot:12802944-Prorocentrum_lima.AAC.1